MKTPTEAMLRSMQTLSKRLSRLNRMIAKEAEALGRPWRKCERCHNLFYPWRRDQRCCAVGVLCRAGNGDAPRRRRRTLPAEPLAEQPASTLSGQSRPLPFKED